MEEIEIKKRVAELIQTDGRTEDYVVSARKKNPRSFIQWQQSERELVRVLSSIGYDNNMLSDLLGRTENAIEYERQKKENNNDMQVDIFSNNTQKVKAEIKYQTINEKSPVENKLIKFWRNCLSDSDMLSECDKTLKNGIKVSLFDLQKGELAHANIQKLFLEAEKKLKGKPKVLNMISVVIAPFSANNYFEHGNEIDSKVSAKKVFPLYVNAKLSREGKFFFDDESPLPWINRNCLYPNESSDTYPIISDVEDVDHFYTVNEGLFSGHESWLSYWSAVLHFFEKVIGGNIRHAFSKNRFTLIDSGYLCLSSAVKNSTMHIINTYDQYSVDKSSLPKLLTDFCQLEKKDKKSDLTKEELFLYSKKHVAQMQSKFPLSLSQRKALHYFFDEVDNDIFTVNGPPGTGKTTLLHSVIASLWVENAIEAKMPPIIVASSASNLAIINILDGLKIDEKNALERWLPEFDTFGLYLCSPSFEGKNDYLHKLKEKNSGNIDLFYQVEYQQKATNYFLEKFNERFSLSLESIEECQKFLHDELLNNKKLLDKCIQFSFDYYMQEQDFLVNDGTIEQLKEQHNNSVILLGENKQKITALEKINSKWLSYKIEKIGFLSSFTWLPFVHRKVIDKIKLFVSYYTDVFNEDLFSSEDVELKINNMKQKLKLISDKLDSKVEAYNKKITRYQLRQDEKYEIETLLQLKIEDIFNYEDPKQLLSQLDKGVRFKLFDLATHYWEARWLDESYKLKGTNLKHTIEGRTEYWQIQSMLTPCLITTLYSGPSFFQYRKPSQEFHTMPSVIDLLIIDEAGQVMPSLAGAMVSASKRVLLVGDAKQIQPIFKLSEGIDFSNSKKFHLCKDAMDYENHKSLGFLCSGNSSTGDAYGNLILFGQHHAKYHLQDNSEAGMLLLEHRRCAKEIINYCNELCYDNQLQVLTDEEPSPFPRMGYAHIKGNAVRKGQSLCNPDEAVVIVAWLISNREKILGSCNKEKLSDCVGIVTPFSAQANVIKDELKKYKISLDKVGTTHTMQGAEKPIILFSMVYSDALNKQSFFFDRSPNLLNVAVSRAKSSFLVFGDMDILGSKIDNNPSSLLASYLFSKTSNEITDIKQLKNKQFSDDEVEQLFSLDMHRATLKNAFNEALYQLSIVSPYLTNKAVSSDNIIELIRSASSKIKVKIYTDPTLNIRNDPNEFEFVVKALIEAGADVFYVTKVHSKLIIIDNKTLIQGSFNWLSSSRDPVYTMIESSVIYKGGKVSEFINNILVPIEKKVIKQRSYAIKKSEDS